jgi:hypothetical protein
VSGYIEAGYVVALGSLAIYALSLVTREHASRQRLPPAAPRESASGAPSVPDSSGESS